MFSRRDVLLSSAGALLPASGDEMDSDSGLVVHRGRKEGPVVLLGTRTGEGYDSGAINGLGSGLLGSFEEFREAESLMFLELRRGYSRLWLPGVGRPCRVRTPNGQPCFAASWALPVLNIGNSIGYDLRDVEKLVEHSATAEFHWREDEGGPLELPPTLRTCRAVHMTYLGEGLSLTRLNHIASSIEAELPASADFLFATAERSGWLPWLLLTVFD